MKKEDAKKVNIYIEYDCPDTQEQKAENITLAEALSKKTNLNAYFSITCEDGGGVPNDIIAFEAKLGESGNTIDAADAWTQANQKPLPGLIALTQGEGFSVIAICKTKIKVSTARRYNLIAEKILKQYHDLFSSPDKLEYSSVPIGFSVIIPNSKVYDFFENTSPFSSDDIKELEEIKTRKRGLPETIDVSIDRKYPGGEGKKTYRTTVALSDDDQLMENAFEFVPSFSSTKGIALTKEHKKQMKSLSLNVYEDPTPNSWPDKTKRIRKGSADEIISIKKTGKNVRWFIEHCMRLKGVHDLMTKAEYLYDEETKAIHSGTQIETALISSLLEEKTGWSDCYFKVSKTIQSMIAENPIHPFLNAIPEWDRHDHIGDLIDTILLPEDWNPCDLGLEEQKPLFNEKGKIVSAKTYVRIILETWMRCCIKRVQKHVDKSLDFAYPANHVPVFVGPQGCYKNTWIRNLCFVDGMLQEKGYINPLSKDDTSIFLNCVVCHLDEIDSNTMRYSDMSALKQLISKTTFEYRAPYDRRATICVNQCSFIGSTNRDVFLTDETGNRRFFIIPVNGFDVSKNIDYAQVWAQAKYEVSRGFPIFVPRVFEKINMQENKQNTAYGIAPILASLIDVASRTDEADERFTSVSNMFSIAYSKAFGSFDPKAMTNEALNKFSSLLKEKLGVVTNLSSKRYSKRSQKLGKTIKIFPFKLI